MEYPIEGDLLESKSHEIYDIIGFDHPPDRSIAYIRYVPQSEPTDRKWIHRETPLYFKKYYELSDRLAWIKNAHPENLIQFSQYDFPFQTLPNSQILTHFRPESVLTELTQRRSDRTEKTPMDKLYTDIIDLTQFIIKEAQIPENKIGVTGSLATGLANENSDFDLIIYGFHNGAKVRNLLREIFQGDRKETEIARYSKDQLKALYQTRAKGSSISFFDFLKYEFRKLHQGTFRNRDFFIRYLEHPDRETYRLQNRFERQQIRILGRVEIAAEVRGDQFWWTTPARLEIANVRIKSQSLLPTANKLMQQYDLKPVQISHTYTLRGRFIENARLLEHIHAFGTLELVIRENAAPFLQLNLGPEPNDFLIQA